MVVKGQRHGRSHALAEYDIGVEVGLQVGVGAMVGVGMRVVGTC